MDENEKIRKKGECSGRGLPRYLAALMRAFRVEG